MAHRKAFALPMTLVVFAHREDEAREAAAKIAQGIGAVIDTVDTGAPDTVTGTRRTRRTHLNYSTAEIHEIPRARRRSR